MLYIMTHLYVLMEPFSGIYFYWSYVSDTSVLAKG